MNTSVDEAFSIGSFASKFHADNAKDSITLRFSKGGASDDGDGFTKVENTVDPSADPEVSELLLVFLSGLSW